MTCICLRRSAKRWNSAHWDAWRHCNGDVWAQNAECETGERGDKEKNTSVKAQINQYCSGRGSCCVLL